jgi:hypothetical protein
MKSWPKTAENQESDARLEIQRLHRTLAEYGIKFKELADASPKAGKTKAVCETRFAIWCKTPCCCMK